LKSREDQLQFNSPAAKISREMTADNLSAVLHKTGDMRMEDRPIPEPRDDGKSLNFLLRRVDYFLPFVFIL